jgi:hypothetical protein
VTTVSTTYRPGVVEVTAPGVYRLSELRDEAAQRFADELERPVDWPTLVGTRETGPDAFVASFALEAV